MACRWRSRRWPRADHAPARYDDEVAVAVCLTAFPSRGITFTYEIRRAADALLLATGSTKHIALDREGQVQRMPDAIRARIVAGMRALASGL